MKIKITDKSSLVPATGVNSISAAVSVMNKQLVQWSQRWVNPLSSSTPHMCYAAPTSWDWEVIVFDDPDQADALGYHDVTPGGKPYGKVFAKVCKQYNVPWISVLSHEVLELVGDPSANMWAHDANAKLWAYEMCDAVQDWLYTIDGIAVSDFVLPNYFIPTAPPPYDYMGKLTKPFTINKGYSIVAQLGTVSNIFGLIKRPTTKTSTVADAKGEQVLQRPDKQFAGSRTQRRLHSFD